MSIGLKTLVFSGSLLAIASVATLSPRPGYSAQERKVSLLQTLAEWKYPDASLFDGASMSDAGIPPMQAVKCTAVLTTPDPIEKVIEFYTEKLKAADDRPVSAQDDSKGRPLTLRVFVVDRVGSSTTLAISRAEGEKETHIAWTHFIRFYGPK
jgi:hypothetical protein